MCTRTSFILLLISSSKYLFTNSQYTPIVRTPSGLVRGTILRTVWNGVEYSSFKGIPYAKPPLGDFRFKPAVPIRRWIKVLNAYKEGSVCPQSDSITSAIVGHEDCLYLNVFTPETVFKNPVHLRPVMVWIHAGGYRTGYSNSSLYGPDFFLEEDVVFVSFNYRLGVLGFLALNHPDATGNAGLKDQNLVLRWVQRNIAAFGGDPKQVTLFGESAGGTSVSFHALSKKSRGLFQRSISMSGTSLCPWSSHTPQEMIANALQLAAFLGIAPIDIDDLLIQFRKTPATKLIEATTYVSLNFLPFRPTIESPAVDRENSTFLAECPVKLYQKGDFYHHPMMLGFTHDEVLTFLASPMDVANMVVSIKKYFEDIVKSDYDIPGELADQIAQHIRNMNYANFRKLTKIVMDITFIGPIDLTQRLLAEHNSDYPIYYYRLSYQTEYSMHKLNNNSLNGTAHFDDVGYIFNAQSLHAPTDPKNEFNRFRKKMVSLWANFAKFGDPTPKCLNNSKFDVTWVNSGIDGLQLDIDSNLTMHHRLIDEETETYEKLLNSLLPLMTPCYDS
ncbi:Venom carboxylesterase-6 [Habropoda laboriosa]|uniref:Carboxylic ester hydrolase n=1 Tax=Habropoda laboriosa TaxID=597456 RepID=A0A0L7R8H3_9HYME|nr:Venom carboxylesterase-6 [Habropoda laboriosa]